jgi:hypothetical protein
MGPTNFYTLPFELRALILHFAVTAASKPAQSRHDLDRTSEEELPELKTPFGTERIRYGPQPCTSLDSLLLVSHQMHNEALEAVKRIPKDFYLDILLESEEWLVPTWTYVPARYGKDGHKPDLFFNIRIRGVNDNPEFNGFLDDLGYGAGPCVWDFYIILGRALLHGPHSPSSNSDNRPVLWETLHINIETPTDLPSDGLAPPELSPHELPYNRIFTSKNYLMHPENLLTVMSRWLLFMIESGKLYLEGAEDYPNHGIVFFCRLSAIHISIDGVLKREIAIPAIEWAPEFANG